MSFLAGLNDAQRRAVDHHQGPLLVVAGAGSGKTRALTHRIAHLIGEHGADPGQILAVTFTNKAAREMKERVGKLLRGNSAEGLTVSTFHQLGLKIIRSERRELGLKAGFSIFDGEDTRNLIRDLLIQEHGAEGDQAGTIAQLSNRLGGTFFGTMQNAIVNQALSTT